MRKQLLLNAIILLCSIAIFAQTRTITGSVKDGNGQVIPYASILIKGTNTGTTADAEGKFTINVQEGQSLIISAAGLGEQELKIGSAMNYDVILEAQGNLEEVVVTALGVRRAKNTLPYAAQQVNGEDISKLRTGNAASALSGKVSGVEIRQGNGIGGSTNIVVRGTKSLTQSNQAMFVVDGVPIDNSNTNTSDQRTGRGGFDYGNAAADINPDDIETINVLKGAAATALYGSRAANGVIMITTKKAKKGLGVTVNAGLNVGSIDKSTYARYQNQYGAGYSADYSDPATSPNSLFWYYFDVDGDGTKDLVVPTTEDASYGAKFDPNLMVYHWDAFDPTSPNFKKPRPWVAAQHHPDDFYETAVSSNYNVAVSGGSDKGTFKLSYTRNDEKGTLPNSRILKNIVNLGSTYDITSRLTAAASINFSKIQGKGRYGTGYDNWNVNQSFRQWNEANMDVYEQKDAFFRSGKNVTWNWSDPSSPDGLIPIYTDNPYWARYKNYETDQRDRYFGYVSLNYKITDWLGILGRVSLDSYSENQEERIAVGSNAVSFYGLFNRTFREYNYDVMANFDKDLSESFNLKALAGLNVRRSQINSVFSSTNGGLVVPDLYAVSNSVNPPSAPTEGEDRRAVDGYFAGATLGYNDFLFLDGTFRRDRSSTLPTDKNAYNYYSVSGSWLFSNHLKYVNWLSYGKLRANYATVGNDAPFGSLKDIYIKPDPYGNAILFTLPSTKNNNELVPEQTESKEIGLEMAFFQSRLGFDVTYYNTNTKNQIMAVDVSTATGYSSKYVNAGEVENKGVEVSLYATPVRTKDFSWTINVNWTQNRNKVVALYDTAKNLPLGSFQGGVTLNATLNEPYGALQGKTWDLVDGQKLVKSNGRYSLSSASTHVIGNINPDWVGGVYNTFKYKNFSLGFLVDMRKGGDVFSLDLYYGLATGIYPETAALNDLGNPSRNSIADGGGVIMPGVTADGKPNEKRVENTFGTYGYAYNPQDAFVYDASFIKLRELSLSYGLPGSLLGNSPFKGVEFSVIGRNLWIIHKNLPYADPEENLSSGNIQGYQSGAYPTTRYVGFNVKVNF